VRLAARVVHGRDCDWDYSSIGRVSRRFDDEIIHVFSRRKRKYARVSRDAVAAAALPASCPTAEKLLLGTPFSSFRLPFEHDIRHHPGPTLGMSWCSLSLERYSLKSFTLSRCDLLAMERISFSWVFAACSSNRRSAAVRVSAAGGGTDPPSATAASSASASLSFCEGSGRGKARSQT